MWDCLDRVFWRPRHLKQPGSRRWAPAEHRCYLACRILTLMIGAKLKNEGAIPANAWSPKQHSFLPGSKTDSENHIWRWDRNKQMLLKKKTIPPRKENEKQVHQSMAMLKSWAEAIKAGFAECCRSSLVRFFLICGKNHLVFNLPWHLTLISGMFFIVSIISCGQI